MEIINTVDYFDFEERNAILVYENPKTGKPHYLWVKFDYSADVQIEKSNYYYPGSCEATIRAEIETVSAYVEDWDYARKIRPSVRLLKTLKLDIENELETNYEDKIIENYLENEWH
jgi:hypothetical protein